MADEIMVADNERIRLALVQPEAMDVLLEEIKGKLIEFKGDISTDKGRKEIASMAYKVARTKTTIDNFGKELVGAAKAEIKKIDDVRKKAWDTLERYKDVVRKPLTEWELAQTEGQAQIDRIAAMGSTVLTNSAFGESLIADLQLVDSGKIPENLRPYFEEVVAASIAKLKDAVVVQRTREEEAAELERLRNFEKQRIAKEEYDAQVAAAAERLRADAQAKIDAEEAAEEAAPVVYDAEGFGYNQTPNPVQQASVTLISTPTGTAIIHHTHAVSATTPAERHEAAMQAGVGAFKNLVVAVAPLQSARAVSMNDAFKDFLALGVEREPAIAIVKAISEGKVRHVTIAW